MKFEEVFPALREGRKIRRKYWWEGQYIKRGYELVEGEINNQYHVAYGLTIMDLDADDWEIIKETKKVKLRDLTEEQYNKWVKNNCTKYANHCDGCPFQKVRCANDKRLNDAWYLNKDFYSDKFLDQEIEVEE